MNPTGKSIHGAALGHRVRPRAAASTGKSLGLAARPRDGTAIASKQLSNWEQGTAGRM